jgi:DNA-directed RNA polymerase specialized sigma24 family protein
MRPRRRRSFLRRGRKALRTMTPLQRKIFLAMRFEDLDYELAARRDISASWAQREFAEAFRILQLRR